MIIICCDTNSIRMSAVLVLSPLVSFFSIKRFFNFFTISSVIFEYKLNLLNKLFIESPIGVYFPTVKVISSL